MGCGSKQPKGLEYLQRLKSQAAKGVGTAKKGKSFKQQREWKCQRGLGAEQPKGLRS